MTFKNIFKTKDWQLIKNFARFFKPYKKWIFISLISIPVTATCTLLFLHLVQQIIDVCIIPAHYEKLKLYAVYLCVVLLVILISDFLYNYSFNYAGNGAILDLRKQLFAKTLKFPLKYYDKTPVGITLSRLTSDMESLSETFASGILGLTADFVMTISMLTYLFFINWKLAMVVILIAPAIYITIRYLQARIRHVYNSARKALAASSAYLQECLTGMKMIQLYAAEEEAAKKFGKHNADFCAAQNKSNVYDAILYSVIEGITSVATGLILFFGARSVWNMEFSIGVLIVFISTLNKLFSPIKQFSQQITTIQSSLSALEHINDLFQQDEEENEKEKEPITDTTDNNLYEIKFTDVYFSYSPDGPDILKGINFTLKKGQRIALVGSTGSGKSTIIKVLTKAYTGYRGSITINGRELSTIPIKQINNLMTIMQQDVFLFNDTVEFNISLGRNGITPQDVKKAAGFVYADTFINDLPNTYNYKIQDNGQNLSKGQAQLISFARSISGNCELIILDEATSSVDSLTEKYIQKAIENIFNNKTVIAIAHRLSTIKHSDLILVLDDGKIIEQGNHSLLMEQNGKYAQLINNIDNEVEV